MHKTIVEVFEFTKKMSAANLKYLTERIAYKTLDKGAIITGEGGKCTGIPFVLSGIMRLFRTSETGRDMTLYKIYAGEPCIMAAACVMGGLKYDFSAQAHSECELAIISPNTFKLLMQKSSPFQAYFFQMLANKLVVSLNTIEMVNFISIEQRIKSYLQQNANDNGELSITHEQIAIDLGSTREVISRNLKNLSLEGVLVQNRGHIKLIE